jgi:hypothetical protein
MAGDEGRTDWGDLAQEGGRTDIGYVLDSVDSVGPETRQVNFQDVEKRVGQSCSAKSFDVDAVEERIVEEAIDAGECRWFAFASPHARGNNSYREQEAAKT